MKIPLISTNRNNLPVPVMPIGACIGAQATEQDGRSVFLLGLMFSKKHAADIPAALARRRMPWRSVLPCPGSGMGPDSNVWR